MEIILSPINLYLALSAWDGLGEDPGKGGGGPGEGVERGEVVGLTVPLHPGHALVPPWPPCSAHAV